MLGNGRLEAMCFDGVKRLCHIRYFFSLFRIEIRQTCYNCVFKIKIFHANIFFKLIYDLENLYSLWISRSAEFYALLKTVKEKKKIHVTVVISKTLQKFYIYRFIIVENKAKFVSYFAINCQAYNI
jgi:hypothetical protein